MSSYISHAETELALIGYSADCVEPNSWMRNNVLELLDVFDKQGHSGTSASHCISLFAKLAAFKPLCPIMCTEDEWSNIAETNGEGIFQNKRCSAVFKQGRNGKPYYLDAITWKTQNGSCFSGIAEGISSKQNIRIPFTPKSFYIDVIEKEIAPGDWEFTIKDRSQLDEVFQYYEEPEDMKFTYMKPKSKKEIEAANKLKKFYALSDNLEK